MSIVNDIVSVRSVRLENIILGRRDFTQGISNNLTDNLNKEVLLDGICLLYDECNKDGFKKKDKNISDFVNKFRDVVSETKQLRVNIKDFEIKTIIGKGHFGEVHLVSEKQNGDLYAMKTIPKQGIFKSQFKEERYIMANCTSEWLTSLQYSFYDAENLYLVMEYLPGGNLLNLMNRYGPFDEEFIRFYLAELTEALNALHKLGFVHRDVKPENIILDRCGHLKLADFGSAVALNKDGTVTCISPVGTPEYIAPELLDSLNHIPTNHKHDEKCDFWSMGIIGYEFICETTPFYGDDVSHIYSKISKHCENNKSLTYPKDMEISKEFNNLLNLLITNNKKRMNYSEITQHEYFNNVSWNNLRHQIPPIIPTIKCDDDISNFDEVTKSNKKNTYITNSPYSNGKLNTFSGENLPFLGYTFIKDDAHDSTNYKFCDENKFQIKVKELLQIISTQKSEINDFQKQLLSAQHYSIKSDSLTKILNENKMELKLTKDNLKQKTLELATLRTEIDTLKGILKIERENCMKNETKIKDIFRSTQQKYEKEKHLSDTNYEKQLFEKKLEISNLNDKLNVCDSKLNQKLEECNHLEASLLNYKDLLKKSKDHLNAEKIEYEKSKKQLIEVYEEKINEFRNKIKLEKSSNSKKNDELNSLRRELNDSISNSMVIKENKKCHDRNITELNIRLRDQIDENKELRESKLKIEKCYEELKKQYDDFRTNVNKIKEDNIKCDNRISDGKSEDSLPFKSARGSFNEQVEEQLRNDLSIAKENEEQQRKKVKDSEQIIKKLEEILSNMNQTMNSDILEKQNEKLGDRLTEAREQAIIERQSARTAHLTLWKLEKQLEDLNMEKKSLQRRFEQAESLSSKFKEDKLETEVQLKKNNEIILIKENYILELKKDLDILREENKKVQSNLNATEKERTNDKYELLEKISKIQNLEEKINENQRKINLLQQKNDNLILESKTSAKESKQYQNEISMTHDKLAALQQEYDNIKMNYEMLKEACNITEVQLSEIENMLEKEVQRNKQNSQQINDLWTKLRKKDEEVLHLQANLNEIKTQNLATEAKYNQLIVDFETQKEIIEQNKSNLIKTKEDLKSNVLKLYSSQESNEVIESELSNSQRIILNLEHELLVLKEENSKILTSLFITKEDSNKLINELKELKQLNVELKQENEHLLNTMVEIKKYYGQRDIKTDETMAQQKKLIDYLQIRVEELQQKKKKNLANLLFGSNSSKKENISANFIDNSCTISQLREELKLERRRTKQLTDDLLKAKTNLREINCKEKQLPQESHTNKLKTISPKLNKVDTNHDDQLTVNNDVDQNSYHRFEISIDNNTAGVCNACGKFIIIGNSFWKCKQCNLNVHRKCRSDVKESCVKMGEVNFNCDDYCIQSNISYQGDVLIEPHKLEIPIKVNCVYEMNPNIILLGCETGLYSFHKSTKNIVSIAGLKSVNYIAITPSFSKVLIIGLGGENLYQCDLRHLQNRSQALACLKPKLELTILDLRFVNRLNTERWMYCKIAGNNENLAETNAVAATSSRILILKFDINIGRFSPIRAFDTASPTMSILFTRHTAIVNSDKFFEIDLISFTNEEFLDLSDPSLGHTRGGKPISAFKINTQEFLLCFEEFGIFVDEYGCRSRPLDLNWTYTPKEFIYREPFLFISHCNKVQVIQINKSYTKKMLSNSVDNSVIHEFISVENPKLLAESGKFGVFATTIHDKNQDRLILVDGVKVLQQFIGSIESLESTSSNLILTTDYSSDTVSLQNSD